MRKIFLILALIMLFLTSWTVQADATITVTTTSDSITNDGLCSLREAVIAANTDSPYNGCPTGSGDDTILFSQSLPEPATFTLNRLGADEDDSMTGDLDLKGTLTITGQGVGGTILDGNYTDRVFDVHAGAHITLSGITIQNGKPPGIGLGGGILVQGLLYLNDSLVDSNQPGGILNDAGGLILNNVTISNNTAGYGLVNQNSASLAFNGGQVSGNQGGGIYNNTSTANLSDLSVLANTLGGGIFSTGFTLTKLTVDHSLIADNTSTANGGGIFNEGVGAVADISTSRFTGNQADTAGGGVYNNGDASDNGGGLYNRGNSVLTNVTLSGNTANGFGTGGNIFNDTAQLSVRNTIVANSAIDGNCFNSEGAIHSGGHNLDSGNTCGFTELSDLISTPPMLGVLQNNGGPTPTHALLETSPAINQGDDALCPATDQRGVSRPQGAACDIGAYEFLPDSVADLAIVKSGTPDPVQTGEILTYTLSVSNAGPDSAVLVVLSLSL
jgi:CSLREA domain-containing protein